MNPLDAALLRALHDSAVHLPGGDLGAQLGASHAQLAGRIDKLRAAGFQIDEQPGLGYRLIAAPDRLIAEDLAARLGPSPLVQEILVLASTDSTNDHLARVARRGGPAGLAVFAEHQRRGRGRFGRRWESASHLGVWFSLLLRPGLPVEHWPRLPTWAATGVASAIEESHGLRAEIKWPNDVQIGGRKVGGILIESGSDLDGKLFAVVGIGINANHTPADFPPELAGTAGSLRIALGHAVDRTALAAAVLRSLSTHYAMLRDDPWGLVDEARRRSTVLGRRVEVRLRDILVAGTVETLDKDGHLLLRLPDGSILALCAGEVSLVAQQGVSGATGSPA